MPDYTHPLDLLDLVGLDGDRFLGPNPRRGAERLFGGQVLGQGLRAAIATVAGDRWPNSLHAYFVRAGRQGEDITFEVARTRDGRSFSTRRVNAIQDGADILIMAVSFHVAEEGVDWQVPSPARSDELETMPVADQEHISAWQAYELRSRGGPHPDSFPVAHPVWMRTRDRLPDDPTVHACVLASMSDIAVSPSTRGPYLEGPQFAGASLDHALWFHRPFRVDDWLRIETTPVSNASSLGLSVGAIHDRHGARVASVAQEALIRPIDAGRAGG